MRRNAYGKAGEFALQPRRTIRDNKLEKEITVANTVRDPVCGMDVDPATAAVKSEYKGQTYYFCSPGCKRDFDKDPEKYLGQGAAAHQHTH